MLQFMIISKLNLNYRKTDATQQTAAITSKQRICKLFVGSISKTEFNLICCILSYLMANFHRRLVFV